VYDGCPASLGLHFLPSWDIGGSVHVLISPLQVLVNASHGQAEFVIDASLPVFILNVHGIDALIPAVTPDWAEVLLYGHPILSAECSPLALHGLLRGLVHAPDM
jgi:hypothetical protein